MRIKSIDIKFWRHFHNLRIDVADDAGLICLVGANGTGKSHMLELISACAHTIGLSQGVEIPRGDPFSDPHEFTMVFHLAHGANIHVETLLQQHEFYHSWDRSIVVKSKKGAGNDGTIVSAGGLIDNSNSSLFVKRIISALRTSKSVHFVSLDADRSYPKLHINSHHLAEAYETPWESSEWTRGRSFKATRYLYDEWIRYFFSKENQAGSALL